jgi:hypothetical protein
MIDPSLLVPVSEDGGGPKDMLYGWFVTPRHGVFHLHGIEVVIYHLDNGRWMVYGELNDVSEAKKFAYVEVFSSCVKAYDAAKAWLVSEANLANLAEALSKSSIGKSVCDND